MHNGFYEDYDTFCEEAEAIGDVYDSGFDFLDVGIRTHNKTPYNFIHVECNVFASFLHDKYGYKIESVWNKSGEYKGLVHSYCVKEVNGIKYYIDVRGITDSWHEFIQEFYDNGLWNDDSDESYFTDNTLGRDTYQHKVEWDEAYKASEVINDEYLFYYDIEKFLQEKK